MTKTEKLNQIEADLDNIYDQLKKANSPGETIKLLTEKMVLEGQRNVLNVNFNQGTLVDVDVIAANLLVKSVNGSVSVKDIEEVLARFGWVDALQF